MAGSEWNSRPARLNKLRLTAHLPPDFQNIV